MTLRMNSLVTPIHFSASKQRCEYVCEDTIQVNQKAGALNTWNAQLGDFLVQINTSNYKM